MKIKTYFIISVLLCFFLATFYPALSQELNNKSGKAAYCFDGDTFKMQDRRIARLAGIDAPEVAHGDKKAQFYSQEAKRKLIELIKGKDIFISYPGIKNRDHYGRYIVEIFLPDGSSINEKMIEDGAAFFYPHKDLGQEFQEKLRLLQAKAIHERRGLWKELLSSPVANEPYIGNENSLRFFPADCPEAQRIKARNRVNFGNLMDAFLAGYAPARICPFWPLAK